MVPIPLTVFSLLILTAEPCKSQQLFDLPSESSFLATFLKTTVEGVNNIVKTFNFLEIPSEDVQFFLYPPNSNDTITLNSANFADNINPDNPTKIITHGWTNNGKEPWIQEMASLYHQTGEYNVIAVDWEPEANRSYLYSSTITLSVGNIVGDYILEIKETFPNFLNTLHLVGHSLGAQVSGFAGKRVLEKSGELIDRITGLDPAGPLFEIPIQRPFDLFLTKSDATFVDIIHTSAGFQGVLGLYGNLDFYPDSGGPIQSQCLDPDSSVLDMLSCSHHASHIYFSQTIVEPHKYEAVACEDRVKFNVGVCSGNEKAYMGNEASRDAAEGAYYLIVE